MSRAILLFLGLAACRDWDSLSERGRCSGGPPSRCEGADLLLCDGFEDGVDPTWTEVESLTTVERSDECAFRGGAALAVNVGELIPGDMARGDLNETSAVPPELYLRLFVRPPAVAPANAIKLAKVGEAEAPNDGLVLRIEDGALVVNNSITGREARSDTALPMDAWSCVELQVVEGTPGLYRVWVDEVPVPDLERSEDTAPATALGRLNVGIIGFDAVDPEQPFAIHFDEVAVAEIRIGCDA